MVYGNNPPQKPVLGQFHLLLASNINLRAYEHFDLLSGDIPKLPGPDSARSPALRVWELPIHNPACFFCQVLHLVPAQPSDNVRA